MQTPSRRSCPARPPRPPSEGVVGCFYCGLCLRPPPSLPPSPPARSGLASVAACDPRLGAGASGKGPSSTRADSTDGREADPGTPRPLRSRPDARGRGVRPGLSGRRRRRRESTRPAPLGTGASCPAAEPRGPAADSPVARGRARRAREEAPTLPDPPRAAPLRSLRLAHPGASCLRLPGREGGRAGREGDAEEEEGPGPECQRRRPVMADLGKVPARDSWPAVHVARRRTPPPPTQLTGEGRRSGGAAGPPCGLGSARAPRATPPLS